MSSTLKGAFGGLKALSLVLLSTHLVSNCLASPLPNADDIGQLIPNPLEYQGNCYSEPITLPIRNVSLSDNADSKGIPVLVGIGHEQYFGLHLTTLSNHTRFRNIEVCKKKGGLDERCIAEAGGAYSTDETDFTGIRPGREWNATDRTPMENGDVLRGWDSVVFEIEGNSQSIRERTSGYPIEVVNRESAISVLGLGPNSTFIDIVVGKKQAASKAWALRMGSNSVAEPTIGNLTIGGYDASHIQPGRTWTNFSMLTDNEELRKLPCPLKVLVRDMTIIGANGSKQSLLSSRNGKPVPFCVDPAEYDISIPKDMFGIFAGIVSPSLEQSNSRRTIFPSSSSNRLETLEVELDNGYLTKIPRSELVFPPREITEDGDLAYESLMPPHLETIITTSDSESSDLPMLGGAFLAQNYLLVDYQASRFSLAPANKKYSWPERSFRRLSYCFDDHEPEDKVNMELVVGGSLVGFAGVVCSIAGAYYLWWKPKKMKEDNSGPYAAAGGGWKALFKGKKGVMSVATVGVGAMGVAGVTAPADVSHGVYIVEAPWEPRERTVHV